MKYIATHTCAHTPYEYIHSIVHTSIAERRVVFEVLRSREGRDSIPAGIDGTFEAEPTDEISRRHGESISGAALVR